MYPVVVYNININTNVAGNKTRFIALALNLKILCFNSLEREFKCRLSENK